MSKPPKLKIEAEIMTTWQGDVDIPLVSISCITFNHENYIEDAINGFLMQETDFPFEILIHDDASTDCTADIIRQYEQQYPKLIKPVYQTENQFSKGVRPGQILTNLSKGKYIALCEGDDYWTDPTKLQKQVDFLESNPDYVMSFFNTRYYYQDKEEFGEVYLQSHLERDFTSDELVKAMTWLPTSTRLYRNIDFGVIPERSKVINGDDFLTSLLGNYGMAHFHHEIEPTIYRVHAGGVWQGIDSHKRIETQMNTFFWMYSYYQRIGKREYAQFFLGRYKQRFVDRFSTKEILKLLFVKHRASFTSKVILRKVLGDKRVTKIKELFNK